MNKLIGIIFFLLISQSVFCANNDAPIVTCLEVHQTGDVTIYWQSLDLSVHEFQIFYSVDNTNWSQVGTINSAGQSVQYTHISANANLESCYYYVDAIYSPTIVESSTTVNTIFLAVDNSIEGIATLIWNPVSATLPSGSSNNYEIYMSHHSNGFSGPWNLIADNVENTLYNYTIENGYCYDSLNFKIEIANTFGCSSISNIAGNWFSETIQPEKPIFDSVSIHGNGEVILGWEPSISADALGTVIYRFESGIWISIDTVFNNTISQYVDSDYIQCDNTFQYAIASIDSCGILSPGSYSTPLQPILLHQIDFDLCSATNSLKWEPYINANPEIDNYQIWASENNGTYELIDEISGITNYYNHINVQSTTDYDYYIRAIFGSFSSTSCIKSITTGSFTKPQFLYLANADVLVDNTVDLTIEVDLLPNSCSWEILRSNIQGGSQSVITTFDRSDISTSPYYHNDHTADGSSSYYFYYVVVYDSCGSESIRSNILKTIFLEGIQITPDEIQLNWNSFEGWDGDVGKYYIYRTTNDAITTIPYDSTDALTVEYIDDISSVSTSESKFTYWIQASENIQNSYDYKEKSNSNRIDFFRETEMFLPNAFRPDGNNNIFKPVTTGFGGSNYSLQIYNRWGQLIFESNDFDIGWDGNYNGKPAIQGTYVYILVYQSVVGDKKSQKGTVTLID